MTTIKAKVIDDFHLELERGLSIKTGEVLIKIIEKKPIESLRGAWGYDIDSADFVENMRKSKKIARMNFFPAPVSLLILSALSGS
jgi:hypothetical protein